MRTVLVVAAEPFEVKWIVPPSGFRFHKVTGGAGPRLAAAAVAQAGTGFDAVLSTGMCGALDPELGIGDVFVATEVNGSPAGLPDTQEPYRSGPLVSVDRIVGTVAAKRELFVAGYSAVEMEAGAVLESARRMNVPFYCIRSVSDTAAEEFCVDLNAARDREGRIRVSRILTQALRRPAILPELLRLRRNAETAARALGAFIATCNL
ncbi:MAG: hypothetical protein H7Y20_10845 [Bryobacteraceae bacterium]|nr:hypothetical protein [Bryobacteraceae bacterium]